MLTVNRSAVVIVPKQPFLDWLHRVDPTSGGLGLADLSRDPSIYLFPECDDQAELEHHSQKACEEVFAEQLDGWCRAKERWPENRTWDIFGQWFDYRFQSMLIDLAKDRSSLSGRSLMLLRALSAEEGNLCVE